MRKLFKNRIQLGILSIILALVMSFGVTPLLNRAMTSQVEVIRATKDITKGEEISLDKVTRIKVGQYNLPQGVIKASDQVIGKYATTNIYKDDFFLPPKLSDVKGKENNYLYDVEKDEEYLAVSVTVKTLAAGLSGKLQKGDIISVIGKIDEEVGVIPELKYVEIIATTDKTGKDIKEKTGKDIEEKNKTEESLSTVTLAVIDKQAEKLVKQEQEGDIHIALVHRGDAGVARQYIETQREYILSGDDVKGQMQSPIDTKIESNEFGTQGGESADAEKEIED